ncbi:hypothetical protein Dimus_011345 [Dionaea muscipula]
MPLLNDGRAARICSGWAKRIQGNGAVMECAMATAYQAGGTEFIERSGVLGVAPLGGSHYLHTSLLDFLGKQLFSLYFSISRQFINFAFLGQSQETDGLKSLMMFTLLVDAAWFFDYGAVDILVFLVAAELPG